MATVFWDAKRILMVDVLPPNQTVNAAYYASLLDRLRIEIRSKRRGKLTKGVILLHDNARPHTANLTTQKLNELGWTILDHPPYSPDLAPTDFFSLQKSQELSSGKKL